MRELSFFGSHIYIPERQFVKSSFELFLDTFLILDQVGRSKNINRQVWCLLNQTNFGTWLDNVRNKVVYGLF